MIFSNKKKQKTEKNYGKTVSENKNIREFLMEALEIKHMSIVEALEEFKKRMKIEDSDPIKDK